MLVKILYVKIFYVYENLYHIWTSQKKEKKDTHISPIKAKKQIQYFGSPPCAPLLVVTFDFFSPNYHSSYP